MNSVRKTISSRILYVICMEVQYFGRYNAFLTVQNTSATVKISVEISESEVEIMDTNIMKRNECLAKTVIKGLESRNMSGYYAASKEEALKQALELIPEESTIAMGGCVSAREIGLVEALEKGNYNYLDRSKICSDLDSAMKRARNVAAPVNAQRFDLNIPCRETGKCFDCKSMDTICCQFLITRFSRHTDRIHVILVNDTLGY